MKLDFYNFEMIQSKYHKTWQDSTMAQNLLRAVKVKSITTSL